MKYSLDHIDTLNGQDVYLPMDEDILTSIRSRHDTMYVILLHLVFLIHDNWLGPPSNSACITVNPNLSIEYNELLFEPTYNITSK